MTEVYFQADNQHALEQGARNLLQNCAQCQAGDSVLVVRETEEDGFYDPALAGELCKVASTLGINTEIYDVEFMREVTDPDADLASKMHGADCTIFLARLGDQIRFREQDASLSQIICYALDREAMASDFGKIDYRAFEHLCRLINIEIAAAAEIHVTCPAGTDFSGTADAFQSIGGDITRKRFPVSIFAPVPADGFSGRVVQKGFLTGTGSNYYTPFSCGIEETLTIYFEANRITGFEGSQEDIAAATQHYKFVGEKFGIDTFYVHSWHAGIHPGCGYNAPAAANLERWSGGAFGNPRILHFHTCGNYPPGEISVNVLDPTVRIDGVILWEDGVLFAERVPGGAELLAAYPEMAKLFSDPIRCVGQAECGNLRFG